MRMPYHLFVFSSFHIIEKPCNTILSRPYHRKVKDKYEMTVPRTTNTVLVSYQRYSIESICVNEDSETHDLHRNPQRCGACHWIQNGRHRRCRQCATAWSPVCG